MAKHESSMQSANRRLVENDAIYRGLNNDKRKAKKT